MIRTSIILFISLLAGHLHAADKIPAGYVMQVMEPTGGKILRPEGWHYHERHGEKSWMWTISREDTNGGKDPYDTGVRIQTFMGVEKGTGKTPEAFVRGFIEGKKKTAGKVHRNCGANDQGMFTRICTEVTEGDYRILYSAFWGNGMDIVVISISGAKADEWGKYAKTFDTMGAFELIDMERFTQGGKK
ncbi:MAG: hypothetical protein KF712_04505 [Akkermansiaceae bacterium]|nr:hypothetical protein [Akkermansiaceae bacterium]